MKAVFLDRDGTINRDVHYCRKIEDFEILPGVPEAIKLLNQNDFKVIVVTNQSGIGRGYFSEAELSCIHRYMEKELEKHGANIDAIFYCPHHPDEDCECRKPKLKLILQAVDKYGIELRLSYMIGDKIRDVTTGKRAGCNTIWLQNSLENLNNMVTMKPDYVAPDLLNAVNWIISRE